MGKYVYGGMRRGKSHEADGEGCQDAFSKKDLGFAIVAAVCDGVGSDAHADMGSAFASSACVKYCEDNLKDNMNDYDVEAIVYRSLQAAYDAVEAEANLRGYNRFQCNTTLTMVVYRSGELFYGHVGDSGAFAMFDDGTIKPVTVQQNDGDNGVYPLFEKSKWVTGKVKGRVAAALLCTDGMWAMFHPKRPAGAVDRHSIPYLDWYMDTGYIPKRAAEGADVLVSLQSWLDAELNDISLNRAAEVKHDDIAVVIIQDSGIEIQYQPDEYYDVPQFEDDESDGGIDDKCRKLLEAIADAEQRTQSAEVQAVRVLFETSFEPSSESSDYDPNYAVDIKKRAVMARLLWERLDGDYDADSYHAAAVSTFRLLTNGGNPWGGDAAGGNEYYIYNKDKDAEKGNETCPPAIVLPDDINDYLQISLSGGTQIRNKITVKEWISHLDSYIDNLIASCKKNKGHYYDKHLSGCPWCVMDKRRLDFGKRKKPTEYSLSRKDKRNR